MSKQSFQITEGTTNIIFVTETPIASVLSDLFTICSGLIFIGLGVLLSSTVLQWVGAIVFFLSLLMRTKRFNKLTPDEAIAVIEKLRSEKNETH